MNQLNVQQTGGFPLETDTLEFMQQTYQLLNDLGFIAGNATIISGCVQTGSNISDGVVFYNGELFEFRGGSVQNACRVFEESEMREFEDGTTKVVFNRRWIGFGTSPGKSIDWSSFVRIKSAKQLTADVNELMGKVVPVGAIMMWAGSAAELPDGYALCNGQNGTPDLRSRFVVGLNPSDGDYDTIGKTGGAKTVTLTEAQMPSHSHGGTTSLDGNHTHSYSKASTIGRRGKDNGSFDYGSVSSAATSTAGAHTHTFTTGAKGGGQAHENRPPYYVLAFIQFKGI